MDSILLFTLGCIIGFGVGSCLVHRRSQLIRKQLEDKLLINSLLKEATKCSQPKECKKVKKTAKKAPKKEKK